MMALGHYWAVLVGTGRYLAVLGQYGAVLVGTWLYWVSMERNWLIHHGTGSVERVTG